LKEIPTCDFTFQQVNIDMENLATNVDESTQYVRRFIQYLF